MPDRHAVQLNCWSMSRGVRWSAKHEACERRSFPLGARRYLNAVRRPLAFSFFCPSSSHHLTTDSGTRPPVQHTKSRPLTLRFSIIRPIFPQSCVGPGVEKCPGDPRPDSPGTLPDVNLAEFTPCKPFCHYWMAHLTFVYRSFSPTA